MNINQQKPDLLDILVRKIAKISALVPQTGLMSGKMGIAILLYHYARHKNAQEINEYADSLIDMLAREINLDSGKGLDNGLCGIALGLNHLIKQEFVHADEDLFEEIDDIIFSNGNSTMGYYDIRTESDKGIYILSRLKSCNPSEENIWYDRLDDCIRNLNDIWMLQYTHYELFVFPCNTLIRFFYICNMLYENVRYRLKINALYENMSENVKIYYKEEKSVSDKIMLSSILKGVLELKKCLPFNNGPQTITLVDVINYHLTNWILGQSITNSEIACHSILSIIADEQRFNELLNLLNPFNAGMQILGGLAWTMLEKEKKYQNCDY